MVSGGCSKHSVGALTWIRCDGNDDDDEREPYGGAGVDGVLATALREAGLPARNGLFVCLPDRTIRIDDGRRLLGHCPRHCSHFYRYSAHP